MYGHMGKLRIYHARVHPSTGCQELKDEKEQRLKLEKDDKAGLCGCVDNLDLKRQMAKKEEELRNYQACAVVGASAGCVHAFCGFGLWDGALLLVKEESRKKQEKIDQLVKDRDHNLKEIKDRDRTIGDKEGRIYDLKKQNQVHCEMHCSASTQ
eukprot:5700290-Amphidinium_carterae.1